MHFRVLQDFPSSSISKAKGQNDPTRRSHRLSDLLTLCHSQSTISESGVYYIVPDRNGKGKRIIRKPRPPPTSAPLPEDFDAVTQECTTMKGPDTERGAPSRYSWVPTSPLRDAGNRSRGSLSASHSRPGDSSVRISEREHGLDLTCAAGLEDNGDYSRYVDEIEHMFGRRKPVEVSVRTLQSQRSSTTAKYHGQCSTREYEVVKDRVLEDSSDKTVTISTWREKVAEETSREVEMSVYYINAEDYLDAISEEGGQQARSPRQRVREGRQTPWPREVLTIFLVWQEILISCYRFQPAL